MRITEAYVGEYASGKSEIALNRALSLLGRDEPVTLVDFDLIEPFYTLRAIKDELSEKGLRVLAWNTRDTMGLGEAGNLIRPDMRWSLLSEGSVIYDVGYGISGTQKLKLVEQSELLSIYAVVNIGRPMTHKLEDIVEYVRSLGSIHGIINNSHLGDETTLDFVFEGAKVVSEAGKQLNLPVICTTVDENLMENIAIMEDPMGHKIVTIKRYMQRSFW